MRASLVPEPQFLDSRPNALDDALAIVEGVRRSLGSPTRTVSPPLGSVESIVVLDVDRHNEVMPTALRVGPYRFFFYSGDRDEPSHVHVERDAFEVKFWLDPIRLERSRGFSRKEINVIQGIVERSQQELLDRWNEYFDV